MCTKHRRNIKSSKKCRLLQDGCKYLITLLGRLGELRGWSQIAVAEGMELSVDRVLGEGLIETM